MRRSPLALALALACSAGVLAQGTHELARLIADDTAAGNRLGVAVALDGDTAVVGAVRSGAPGAAYVFVRSGPTWTQQARLVASDGAANDLFGAAVAISGDTVVAGARGKADAGDFSGAAYVFVRSGTIWTEAGRLTASDAVIGNDFGVDVAIEGDTIVIGADGFLAFRPGAAYVFARSGSAWVEQAKLTPRDGALFDFFGGAVALAGDTVLIGAQTDDHAGGTNAGSAYVFVRSGTNWTEQAKLMAADATDEDRFGGDVALDGDTALVGAYDDDHAGGTNAGSAYVFVRNGTSWTEQARLTVADARDQDRFGGEVALDGDTALVGAWDDDHAGGVNAGSAYLFVRSGGQWRERAQLTASDASSATPGDLFGAAVALAGDTVVVGAPNADPAGVDAGAAYGFGTCAWFSGFGPYLPGSDGFVPTCAGAGCTVIGNVIDVEIRRGLGGAMGCFVMGVTPQTLPYLGGTVLVVPIVCLTHVLDGAGAGNGTHTFALRIPREAAFVGAEFLFQGFYEDAGAVQGVSMTQGLHLSVRQ